MLECGLDVHEGEGESVAEEWINSVFGVKSKLEESEFRAQCANKENSWIFNPDEIRRKLAVKAGLDEKKW